jgi:hypothetical protein
MPQQAADHRPVKKEKPKDHVRKLSVENNAAGVRVRGELVVDGHIIPMKYHLPKGAKAEDHERVVKEHRERARRWIERYPAFHQLVGREERVGDADVRITFAQIQNFGPHDWRLYAAWTERGKARSFTWHHRDPGHVMTTEALLEKIRAMVRPAPTDDVNEHKEAIRVAAKHEEASPGIPGNGGEI